jgi:peptide/nickel transport system permease protein
VLSRLIAGGASRSPSASSARSSRCSSPRSSASSSGYFGGVVDQVIMRLTDGLMAIPTFFLLMIVVAIWGSSFTILVLALAFTRWMGVARLVRSRGAALQGDGVHHRRPQPRRLEPAPDGVHLLPQAAPSLIVATSLNVGIVMLIEAGLSFLGLGILPPTASWGNMLSASQYYMWMAPHLAVYPGVLILLAVLSFNALGDVMRDILDPRMRST